MKLSTGMRLTLVAVLAVIALLPAAGWMIATAYERSALESFDHRLEAYAQTMAGRLDVGPDGVLRFPRSPRELRFDEVFSGWYWQVRQNWQVVGTSRSLWDSSLRYPQPPPGSGAVRKFDLEGPRGEELRGVALQLTLSRVSEPVELIVTLPLSEVDLEVDAFERLLVAALGTLGVMLVIVFALQIRWGLAPLRRLERDLQQVRAGTASQVAEALPSDLSQIAVTMNEVLAHQRQLIERARSTAGNLAHALKTPLATLRLRIERDKPDTAGLREDLSQIQRITDHHLARAAAAGRAGAVYHRTQLRAALVPVIDAVRAMHRSRGIELDVQLDGSAEVAVDAQDLQELIGNVLDNAMKWAGSRVQLRTTVNDKRVRLQVDDDGPGIPTDARAQATARGMQLDRDSRGSGLGLAIVRDIAALYDIGFEMDESDSGGLSLRLDLPRGPRK